jgi:FtsP/CotA-like multicopper oxidase with cupredoxin domain
MSRSQRLTFLGIAVAIAVVAAIILASSGGGSQRATPAATPAPSATAHAGATATPAAGPGPLLTGAKEQTIAVKEGETVRFRVRAVEDDEVHVHGYDIEKQVPAGTTVTISFKATITGIFEVELHHSGATLARIKVEPS